MDQQILANLRLNYTLNELSEKNVSQNPIIQFETWFQEALSSEVKEPNALVLSTIYNGKPRSRVVLLKEFNNLGFVFFTNYYSAKGKEIFSNPVGNMTFFWVDLERQVRIEGQIEKITAEESDTYFWSRPISSQIGAWVSEQSAVVADRTVLDEKLAFYENKFKDLEVIPRPKHWGGYRLVPDFIEFWQGRPNRLHDRIAYTQEGENWKIERLSP
jgi:pyridoxamine 5'-phosphate oxidase